MSTPPERRDAGAAESEVADLPAAAFELDASHPLAAAFALPARDSVAHPSEFDARAPDPVGPSFDARAPDPVGPSFDARAPDPVGPSFDAPAPDHGWSSVASAAAAPDGVPRTVESPAPIAPASALHPPDPIPLAAELDPAFEPIAPARVAPVKWPSPATPPIRTVDRDSPDPVASLSNDPSPDPAAQAVALDAAPDPGTPDPAAPLESSAPAPLAGTVKLDTPDAVVPAPNVVASGRVAHAVALDAAPDPSAPATGTQWDTSATGAQVEWDAPDPVTPAYSAPDPVAHAVALDTAIGAGVSEAVAGVESAASKPAPLAPEVEWDAPDPVAPAYSGGAHDPVAHAVEVDAPATPQRAVEWDAAVPDPVAGALESAAPSPTERPAAASAPRPASRPADPIAIALGYVAPAAGAGAPPSEPPFRLTRRERFRAWRFAPIVEIIATVVLALLLAESVQAAVVKPFVIPTGSMEPTLLPGQRVLVNRLAYDFGGTPHRGDIVVFHPPSSLTCTDNVPVTEPCPQSAKTHAGDYFVKRVIGLPGDTLSIKDGHPVINGKELTHEPYITPCANSTSCNMPHTIVIPRGEYYMLGDNRGDSDDSRYWGPVPLSWIIGEVFATYWPIDRIGLF